MSDHSIQELEEQDWTLGGEERQKLIEFRGMEFLVQDPDDETMLMLMAFDPSSSNADVSQKLYRLVSSAVVAPEISLERWQDMRLSERLGLAIHVSDAIGLQDLMDFQDAGLQAQLEE